MKKSPSRVARAVRRILSRWPLAVLCEHRTRAITAFDRVNLGCEDLEERVVPNITLSMPTGLNTFAGGIVAVPISVDQLTDVSRSGLAQASFAVNYDPAVFNINASGDVFLATVPKSVLPSGPPPTPPPGVPPATPNSWNVAYSVNQALGQLGITITANNVASRVTSVWGDSLVNIDFHVQPTAVSGLSAITLATNNTAGPTTTQVLDASNKAYTLNANGNGSVNVLPGVAPAIGSWTPAPVAKGTLAGVSPPTLAGVSTMLQLTNGQVLAQAGGGNSDMFLLTPDNNGDYSKGSWTTQTSMITPRLYYGSVVLKDGRVLILGGEYVNGSATATWSNVGEIFDVTQPVGSQWKSITPIPTPANGTTPANTFGDGMMELLNDGRVLAGWPLGPTSYIYDVTQDPALIPTLPPGTTPWTKDATLPAADSQNDEENWVKLPDGSILTVMANAGAAAKTGARWVPGTPNKWVATPTMPANLVTSGAEVGSGVLLPDGRVFYTGGTSSTAIFSPPTPANPTGSWVAGPTIPGGQGANDAPIAMLPNGRVLFNVGVTPLLSGQGVTICEYDPVSNTINQVTNVPAAFATSLAGVPVYSTRMLVLPTGQILMSDGDNKPYIYTPAGMSMYGAPPVPAWQPVVTGIRSNGGGVYTLTGSQLNGLSEGATYGDDGQMATNFPLVKLTDGNGTVTFAKTTNWSSAWVATGTTPQSVQFTLPPGAQLTDYSSLTVIANGIPSATMINGLGKDVELPESSDYGPAIASVNGTAYVAWTGVNDDINIMRLNADGTAVEPHLISNLTLDGSPALASINNQLYVAWTGQDEHLYISQVNTSGGISINTPVPLFETSNDSPALAALNGNLYIAWTGQGADHLQIMRLNNNLTPGFHFSAGVTVDGSPALATVGDQLYVAFTGFSESLYAAKVNTAGAVSIQPVVELPETSNFGPALGNFNGQLVIAWTGQGANHVLVRQLEADLSVTQPNYSSYYTADGQPALGAVGGQLWLAHNGTDLAGTLYDIPVGFFPLTPAIASTSSGLTVDGTQGNSDVTIGKNASGGLLVSINGRTASYNPGDFPAVYIYLSSATNTVNLSGVPAGLPVTIYAGAGTNTITITPPAGSLTNVAGPLTVIGAGTTDLIIDDSLDTAGETYSLTASTLASIGSATIAYSNLKSVTLKAGKYADVINVRGTPSGTTTTVVGGGGSDAISASSAATAGLLSGIAGPLVVQGNNSAIFSADDTGSAAGQTGTLSSSTLVGLGMGGSISYSALAALNVYLGSGNDIFTIASTASGTTTSVDAGGGGDTINLKGTSSPTSIIGGTGANTFYVSSDVAGVLTGIAGPVTLQGSGSTTFIVDDRGENAGQTGTLTPTTLTGLGMAAGINYSGTTSVTLNLGQGNDNFTIVNTAAGIPTVVNTGLGSDTDNVRAVAGPTTIVNTSGADVVNVGSLEPLPGGVLTGIAASLTVIGAGLDTINVDDTGNFAGDTGTLTNANLTGLGMAGSIVYSALAALNIRLGSGGDTFLVLSSAAPTATLINTGAGKDTVNVRAIGGSTTIVTGSGIDVINVGSLAPATGGILTGIAASLTVAGGGNTTLNADDTGNMAGNTGTLTATQLTGLGMAGSITYSGLSNMNVRLGPGGDTFLVASTASGTSTLVHSNLGNDTINIRTTGGPTAIVAGGGGVDVINVGSLAPATGGKVDGITGPLTITGLGFSESLRVDDTGSTTPKSGSLTATTFTGLGMAGGITYTGVQAASVRLGSADDSFTVASTIAGSTLVDGGPGKDTVTILTTGGDTFVRGGADNDTFIVGVASPAAARIGGTINGALSLDGGTDVNQVVSTADADFTLTDWVLKLSNAVSYALTSIQQAVLTGGTNDNRFDVSGFTGSATLNGGGGIDMLVSLVPVNATLTDASFTRSTSGTFTLSAITRALLTASPTGNHNLDGSGYTGNLTAYAGGGNETITGGSGNDYLVGGTGVCVLAGGFGDDVIYGGSGVGTSIDGGSDDDILYGSTGGSNTITGGPGDDRIYGQGADNILNGLAGNDIIYGGSGGDIISGGSGRDTLIGGPGASTIYGNNAADSGNDHAVDILYAHYGTIGVTTPGVSKLYGQGANDLLYSGPNDIISSTPGTNPFIDQGTPLGANPNNFAAPPAFPPADIPATPAATLSHGTLVAGRWTELAGSAGPNGISSGAGRAIEPSVAADADTQYVAWADDRTGSFQIYVSRESAGAWSELSGSASGGGVSNLPAGQARRPSLTLAANGQSVVAWSEFNGTQSNILVAQYDPAANAGAGAWVGLGNSLGAGGVSGTGTADNAVLLNTVAGLVVAWLDTSSGAANVFARRFNGTSWVAVSAGSDSGTGISAAPAGVFDLAAATDGAKVALAWTLQVGGTRQLYLRESSGGTFNELAGSATGTGISPAPGDKQSPTLAYSGGTLFAAWQNANGAAQEIYAAKFSAGAWTAAGPNATTGGGVSNSDNAATQPRLASGGGQLKLAWKSDRITGQTGLTCDIYVRSWNGTAFIEEIRGDASYRGVSQSATSATTPALAVDPLGRAFVAWDDISGGNPSVRVRGNTFAAGTVYYVNDAVTPDHSFTSAASQAGFDGKSPTTPLPSIQAVLAAYTLQAGDIILVEGGTYAGAISVPASSNGFLVIGSPNYPAILQGAVFLNGSTGVIFENLTLNGGVTVTGGSATLTGNTLGSGISLNGTTGAQINRNRINSAVTLAGTTAHTVITGNILAGGGISIAGPSTGLNILSNLIGGAATGIQLGATSDGVIADNFIRANTIGLNIAAAFTGAITGNDLVGVATGVNYAVSAPLYGNWVHDNATGIVSTVAGVSAGLGFVGQAIPNQVYANTTGVQLVGQMQNQHVFGNVTGVSGSGILGGTDLALANFIEANTTGVTFNGPVQYTRIARGTTGVVAVNNQLIDHVVFDRIGTTSLAVTGVFNVKIVNNTFDSPTANHIVISGAASGVEVRNNILASGGGTDLSVAADSRSGFFSDYNTITSTGTGVLVHFDLDFNDILDWQAALNQYDLHSLGRTAVNPTAAKPQFFNRDRADHRVFDLAAARRMSSPTLGSADPRTDLGIPAGSLTNLLTNPGFEVGLTGWTTQPGAGTGSGNPVAFDGSSYFVAGTSSVGFAQQTITLPYTAAQIDAGGLALVYGGRIRTASETKLDQSAIVITFLDGSGNTIATTSASATDVFDRWELAGDRALIPIGTRQVKYRYETVMNTGPSNDGHLDAAFVSVQASTFSPNQGAWGETADQSAQSTATRIALRSPDTYVDWIQNQSHTIRWQTYGNTGTPASGPLLVRIDLLQDTANGPVLLQTISPSTPDTGSYNWTPSSSGISAGTYGLRFQISLVGEAGVFDRGQEAFTVPENGHNFYLNDPSTTGDQYTSAVGGNRNTGQLPSAPKSDFNALLRLYTLGANDIVSIDTGTYQTFSPWLISASLGVGDDQGFTMTGPTAQGKTTAVQFTNSLTTAPLIRVSGANLMTVSNLALSGAQYGLYATGQSMNLLVRNVTANANAIDGIHIEGGSDGAALENVTALGNLNDGAYLASLIDHVTGGTFSLNSKYGIDLEQTGTSRVQMNTVDSNSGTGILINNNFGATLIGSTDLSLNAGNIVTGNGGDGIRATGPVSVAGNRVSGQAAYGVAGIIVRYGASATSNLAFNNFNGIVTDSGATMTGNRIYHNANIGLIANNGFSTGNVIYSNAIGIAASYSAISNNLVYANTAQGIQVTGYNTSIVNNTVYQTAGDAVNISSLINNIQLRDNILWVTSGYGLNVPSTSQNGFVSDYNLLYVTGTGQVGNWQGVAKPTLQSWYSATLRDGNSLSLDPIFVNPTGTDGVLGSSPTSDGSDDNFHLQSTVGSVKGASSAPVLSPATGLPSSPAVSYSTDANMSPGIDRGDSADSPAAEPAPNGGLINLGWDGGTTLASKSLAQFVIVTNPAGGEVLPIGQALAIRWRSQDANSTVSIDLLQGVTPVLNIASGAANNGLFNWAIPAGTTPGNNYFIRVTRADLPGSAGTSLAPFTIAAATTAYYINDTTVLSGDWTTVPGNDGNDGLTPATPKATINGVLTAYPNLGAGKVIRIDTGVYTLTSNIILTAVNSGITFEGFHDPNYAGRAAVLNRGNTNSGSDVFDLTAATNVTLDHLEITGAYIGVNLLNGANSTGLTISNCDISDYYVCVAIGTTNTGAKILNNVIHDNANNNSGNAGLLLNAEGATVSGNMLTNVNNGLNISAGSGMVTGNTVYKNAQGILISGSAGAGVTVSNNIVTGNTYVGIYAIGNAVVSSNMAYGQPTSEGIRLYSAQAINNTVFDNLYGITDVSGGSIVRDNRIYHNSSIGIIVSGGSTYTGNTVYSNGIGIQGYSNATIRNNLVYANTTRGVNLSGGTGGLFDGNTIYQSAGDALALSGGSSNFTSRNNILVALAGYPVSVTADSETGFVSDYNDLSVAGPAPLLNWGGQLFATRAAMYYGLGLEQNGLTTDPQFVNPAGADGALGFSDTVTGAATIIDDSAAGYSETGSWTTVAGGYGNGTHRQPTANFTSATATYSFTGLTPGAYYQVAANWPAGGYSAVVYSIQSGNQPVRNVTVNQSAASTGTGGWQSFGTFRADAATLSVTIAGSFTNVESDGVRLQIVFGDAGIDDNFLIQSGSPTIDAGSLNAPYSLEPAPNGGRANLGHTGGTPLAATSPAQAVQVLSPNGLEKLTAGQQVSINWRSAGDIYPPAAYVPTVLADSPAAFWRLAETTGTAAADSSGHGLVGTYSGGVILGAAGSPANSGDTAVQFNGTNGVVTVADNALLRPAQVSVEAWVKPDASIPSGFRALVMKTSSTSWGDGYGLAQYSTPGQIYFFVNNYSTNNVSATIPLGQWSHLVGTFNGTTISLYLNGVLVATKAYSATITNSTQPLTIGNQGASYPWKGSIGEVSVYGTALSAAQVRNHYDPRALGTVTIDLMQGANPVPVQTLTTTAIDTGVFPWTVPSLNGNDYKMRVTLNQPSVPRGSSDDFFQIVPAGHDYFIAPTGDDGNNGRSVDQPMASVPALIQAYGSVFQPGDVVHFAAGTYTLSSNIVLGPQENGLIFQGPTGGPAAILNRANTNSTSFVFQLSGAKNVTLDHLTITGAYYGVYAANGANSTGLTVSNCDISDYYAGVMIGTTNSNSWFLNNTIHDNSNGNSGNVGLSINSEGAIVSGNLFSNDNAGLSISAGSGTITGNTATGNFVGFQITGNAGAGVQFTNNFATGNIGIGVNAYGNTQINGNSIYGNRYGYYGGSTGLQVRGGAVASNNSVFDNDTGVAMDSGGTLTGNRIYRNSGVGVSESGGIINGNSIYSNAVGISGSSTVIIRNNLIYANVTGVSLGYGTAGLLDSNTIYQTSGDAFDLSGSASGFTTRDNIFRVASGYGVSVTADSQIGFAQDYDFFSITGTGTVGLWGATPFTSLSEWYYQLGLEQHGLQGDPQFVQPAGPDGILGFSTVPLGPTTIIDDGGAGYSETGSWTTVAGGYSNGSHRQPTGNYTTATANYTFSGLTVGAFYQIAATWPAGGSTTTTMTVHSGYQSDRAVTVNQSAASSGTDGWQTLGIFRADAATLTVSIGGYYVNVEADGVSLQRVEGDGGLDDDFSVQPISKTIDAGSPLNAYSQEPGPNGGRANLGHTGGTAQAATSPAQLVQMTSPNGLEKLAVGQQVNLTWRTSGLQGTPAPVQNIIALDSPSAYYRLGEASGTTAADASGNGLQATYIGSPTLGVAGSPVGGSNTSVQLGGAGQYVRLPSGFSDFTGGLTFEVWAFPTSTANDSRFIDLGVSAFSDIIALGRDGTTNNLTFKILRGGSQVTSVTALGAIDLNVWQHFAVTMDAAGQVTLFKNGAVIATGAGLLPNVVARTNNFLGRNNNSPYGYPDFAGKLDEAVIFNSALGKDRILAHAQALDYGPVRIDLLQNGVAVQTIATATQNNDRLPWTVPNLIGNGYQIQITPTGAPPAVSNGSFQIVPAGHDYYVNDGVVQIGDLTTAIGDNAKTGKTPDQPMASIAAVMQVYRPGALDVIHVDSGNYTVYRDLQLIPINTGLTVQGPSNAGAVLNRANINSGCYVFDGAGATNVTLSNLTITGAVGGINVPVNAGSHFFTVSNSIIYGNSYFGVYLGNGNTDGQLLNNTIYSNNLSGNAYSYGIQIYGARDIVIGNQVYGQNYGIDASYGGAAADGITIANNIVRSNFVTGIQASNAVTVSNNSVYGHSATYGYGISASSATVIGNLVYSNYDGIYSDSRIDGNRVFANTYGINLRYGALVQNNKVYSNQIGIFTSGWSYSGSIQNNVVDSNTGTAIDLQGSNGARVINNTVFQPVGNALRVESNSSNVKVRGNILYVQNGTALSVAADSLTGLINVANVTTDPLFVNPAGADGVLGFRASDSYDGGADDNFYVAKSSAAIDASDSWNAPPSDALGYGRHDDPAIANAGTSDYFTAAPTGTSVYLQGGGPGGVAQNWKADDNYWTLNFPAGFNFPFYDGTYTNVYVSSNGFLQFGSPPTVSNAGNSTAAFLANRRLAPLWSDLRTDIAGNDIYVDTSVTGQVTVRWVATAKLTGGPVNIAVTLFPSGHFRLDYGAGNANLSPTVGASYGNGYVATFAGGYDGAAALADAASVQFVLLPGFIDVGAYEFRGSSADVTPPTVTAVTPASVNAGIANQVRIDFSEEPNPIDAVATANYQLRDAGPDGTFGTSDDQVYQLTPTFVPHSTYVLLNVAGGAPLSRIYQLTVVGSTLHDLSGLQLNGSGQAGSNLVQTGILGLPGVQVAPTSLTLTQGGQSMAVNIVLASVPTSNVILTPNSDPLLSVSPGALTFTTANWNIPQTVTVNAVNTGATTIQMASLQFSAASSDVRYQSIAIVPVSATITPATAVTGFTVNGGATQRSRITTVQVSFATPTDAALLQPSGAITFTRTFTLPGGAVGTVVNTSNGLIVSPASGMVSSVTLTFANVVSAGIDSASLGDGYWRLSIPAASFQSPLNDVTLRRLFGDSDNNGTVDGAIDFPAFGALFNTTGANLAFDFNNDGIVDGAVDFPAFGANFNSTL